MAKSGIRHEIGSKMGDCILLEDMGQDRYRSRMGKFQCACGQEFVTRIRSIKNGFTKSCGCLSVKTASLPKNNYQKGDSIGALVFLNREQGQPGRPMAKFLCSCGNEFITKIDSVKSGRTKSCGCLTKQFIIDAQTIHKPPEYLPIEDRKVLIIPELNDKTIHNFWSKVALTANLDKCWNWTGTGERYGSVSIGRAMYKANRIAYYIQYGVDPKELCVLHKCDNPACVNGNHLFLGTHDENMKDMVKKGRSHKGSKVSNAKLNEEK